MVFMVYGVDTMNDCGYIVSMCVGVSVTIISYQYIPVCGALYLLCLSHDQYHNTLLGQHYGSICSLPSGRKLKIN